MRSEQTERKKKLATVNEFFRTGNRGGQDEWLEARIRVREK